MLRQPTTPSKVDDGIEKIKQSLSTKWGIQFPLRDAIVSPSKKDMTLVEEKILVLIQMLYFREGALEYAIAQFERNAAQVVSEWQFKPHAEPDVLLSLPQSQSALKQDFLRKRHDLPPKAVKQLTENLRQCLQSVVDRIRAGDNLLKVSPIQHRPSSDDYPDHEMAELLANDDTIEILSAVRVGAAKIEKAGDPTRFERDSSSEETFKTPPTTPPRRKDSSPRSLQDKKRSYPDSMQAPPRRNVSRKMSGENSASDSLYQKNKTTAEATHPPDRTNMMTRTTSQHNFTRQPAQDKSSKLGSDRLFGSFDNITSISSSMTSNSSTWTSPNTSFSANSLATSFDSSVDGSDITRQGFWDNVSRPHVSNRPLSELEIHPTNWYENEASNGMKEKKVATFDAMDVDPEPSVKRNSPVETEFTDLQDKLETKTAEKDVGRLLAERLRANSPFVQVPEHYPLVPFRQLYEIIRVASCSKLDISTFITCFQHFESYDSLWSSLSSIAEAHGTPVPEKSSLAAWERASSKFDRVALTGKLILLDQQKGPCFDFHLNPLKLEPSYRLSRQFGSDRFCVVGIPGLGPDGLPSYLRPYHVTAREAIIDWLVSVDHRFLGRTWRAFYAKPDASKKKGVRNSMKDGRYRIYFFAEDGVGFVDEGKRGEADPRFSDRSRKTVRAMIDWFMPFKANLNQPSLKFFARLALGVSSTFATIKFLPSEIFRADDARADAPGPWRLSYQRSDKKKTLNSRSSSDAPVMNDGCARISKNAARGVADYLGLDIVPCVFQGRIGGAKGMWMIDAQDESWSRSGRNYWIEITDSQLKFKGHPIDDLHPEPARVTFEVNAWAKRLSSGSLNFQLIPILVDRGVPHSVFVSLLDQDLTARVGEIEVAMESGLALRKWNQEVNPITQERAKYGGIEMQGGLPASRAETINWFTEHGFQPKTCRYLKDQLYQAIRAYCLRLESKMNIGLGQSTYAYMIADPLAVLEENEIHLGFSNVFHDPQSGFNQSMLHNIDVLVARLPAHLPSDIQKVRAVFKPELMMYRDVIVFPSKGSVSLASKLSGGDYDGDQAWVCWEPGIVQPFRNAGVPPPPDLEFYGIETDRTTVADFVDHPNYTESFLRHAFNFNLQSSMLGICTLYHESYCYHTKAIDSPQAVSIAGLLGQLVDSAKGGYQFDEAKWAAYLKRNGLRRTLSKPAYKDQLRAKPTSHLIDKLVFVVARQVREKVLTDFDKHFTDVSSLDDDLFRLQKEEFEEAKNNKALSQILQNLKRDLEAIHTFWSLNAKHEDPDENARPSNRKPNVLSFKGLVERCRADFLTLKPTLSDTTTTTTNDNTNNAYPPPPSSDRISHWQWDHARGRASYWDLLKASVAFCLYHQTSFVWHVAGVELGEIKAMARGKGAYRVVADDVFEAFKVDRRTVDGRRRRREAGAVEESVGIGLGVGDVVGQPEEDEFGVWDWGIDDC